MEPKIASVTPAVHWDREAAGEVEGGCGASGQALLHQLHCQEMFLAAGWGTLHSGALRKRREHLVPLPMGTRGGESAHKEGGSCQESC